MRKTTCQIYVRYVRILLQFQVSLKPIKSTKCSAPTKTPAVGAKRQRKMLTIAEKVEVLDMVKEGKSYAATGRHYGIIESSVRSIKKEEKNIRKTAAISFNKDAKRVPTVRNKTMVRMESALALWINDGRKKTFAASGTDKEEEEDADASPSSSAVHTVPSAFIASKGWFEKIKKRFGLKNVSLHVEIASADTAEAEVFVSNKFKAIIGNGDISLNKFLIWMKLAFLETNALPHLHDAGRSQSSRI